jgi:hypothetical protein
MPLSSVVHAQTLSTTINAVRNKEVFGSAVLGNIYLDGDSIPDFVIGAPAAFTGGPTEGKAYVYSGSNGQLIRTLAADASVDDVAFNRFGYSLANVGDINSDGTPDLLVGAPSIDDEGFVRFFSGSNGADLGVSRAFDDSTFFGSSVDGIEDVTGDSIPDALVVESSPPSNYQTNLRTYRVSGASSHSRSIIPNATSLAGQYSPIVSISDVDADSYDDILVGSASFSGTGPGAFQIFSGDSLSLITSVCVGGGTFPICTGGGDRIERAVRLNDINQDGVGDFAVGMPSGPTGTGEVNIYSGANRALLRTLPNQSLGDQFGFALANMGDLDGDGADDIAVGAIAHASPNQSNGYVRCFSGRSGITLYTINGASSSGQFGNAVANAGDLNGDGVNDIIIGENLYDPGSQSVTGRVHVYYSPSCLAQSKMRTVVLPTDDGYQLLTQHLNGCGS